MDADYPSTGVTIARRFTAQTHIMSAQQAHEFIEVRSAGLPQPRGTRELVRARCTNAQVPHGLPGILRAVGGSYGSTGS